MMDPYVFDQISGDEEAIDMAMEKARKTRKKIGVLLMASTIAESMSGNHFGDLFEDGDWDYDYSDEIYE